MKKMKKFLGIMLAMVMAVTMLAGCGGSSKESSSSDNGKTLKFGCFSYSESLDPANMINSAWCNSRYGIGECLFKYKDDLSVENTICDEYSTEDNKTWVFHIRDGVKFSNGNDVTPSAIKACWDVLYANKTGSSNPSKFMDYESITPDDDARTLTIVLKQAKADRDRRVDGGRGRRGRSLRSHLRDLGLGLRHGRLDLAPRLMHGQAGDRGLVFGAEHLVVIRPIIDAGANVHAARQRLRSGEFVRLLLIIGHDIGLLLFSCALSLRVYNYRNGRILHDNAARPICRPRRVKLLGVRNLRDSPRGR